MRKSAAVGALLLVLGACTTVGTDEAAPDPSPATTVAEAATTTRAPATTGAPAPTEPAPEATTTTAPAETTTTEAPAEATAPPADFDPTEIPADTVQPAAGPTDWGGGISASVQGGQPVLVPQGQETVALAIDFAVLPDWYCGNFLTDCYYSFTDASCGSTSSASFDTSTVTVNTSVSYPNSDPDTKQCTLAISADGALTGPETYNFVIQLQRESDA